MDNLRLVIGPAPSELSEEALLAKVTARQRVVSEQLAAFREKMMTRPQKAAPKVRGSRKAAPGLGDVSEFMAELKRLGLTMDEFKEHLKKRKGGN